MGSCVSRAVEAIFTYGDLFKQSKDLELHAGNHSTPISSQRMFDREDMPASSSSGSLLSSFASCIESNSQKRSRNLIDGSPCATSPTTSSVISPTDDRCPEAKRHRGWYRIKGREPIARMRNQLTSTRGISSGTQVFSQGSLFVSNTIIPIPARAHKATQTDFASND